MAERLGITQPSYAEYERTGANPTLDTMLRLNKVLGHKIIAMIAGTPQVA